MFIWRTAAKRLPNKRHSRRVVLGCPPKKKQPAFSPELRGNRWKTSGENSAQISMLFDHLIRLDFCIEIEMMCKANLKVYPSLLNISPMENEMNRTWKASFSASMLNFGGVAPGRFFQQSPWTGGANKHQGGGFGGRLNKKSQGCFC